MQVSTRQILAPAFKRDSVDAIPKVSIESGEAHNISNSFLCNRLQQPWLPFSYVYPFTDAGCRTRREATKRGRKMCQETNIRRLVEACSSSQVPSPDDSIVPCRFLERHDIRIWLCCWPDMRHRLAEGLCVLARGSQKLSSERRVSTYPSPPFFPLGWNNRAEVLSTGSIAPVLCVTRIFGTDPTVKWFGQCQTR